MTISLQVFIIACFVCLLIGSAITLAVGAVMTRREPLQELPKKDKPVEPAPEPTYTIQVPMTTDEIYKKYGVSRVIVDTPENNELWERFNKMLEDNESAAIGIDLVSCPDNTGTYDPPLNCQTCKFRGGAPGWEEHCRDGCFIHGKPYGYEPADKIVWGG